MTLMDMEGTGPDSVGPRPLLLVLCGLPGAGKSTLAKSLAHTGDACGMRVTCIHFDDWMHVGQEGTGRDGGGPPVFDPVVWKSARSLCMEAAAEALGRNSDVVILDDTMHYTSMRLRCWKLARERASMYCQVYVDCPLEECLARNAGRSAVCRMPEAVMERMGRIFEAPRESNVWEAPTVVTSASRDLWQDVERCKVFAPPLKSASELDPIIRALTSETVTHQVDVQSRRILGEYMGRLNAHDGRDTRATASTLNEERRKLVDACKQSFKAGEAVQGLGATDGATSSGDHADDDPESAVEHWLSKFRVTCEALGLD